MLEGFRQRFGERFGDVWTLLSDTDRFVARARLMDRYESQLRRWRADLREAQHADAETLRRVRGEITEFRKARRAEGWELRLGSLDVQVKGFRSDEAMGVGFVRMVLYVSDDGGAVYLTGSANHIELDDNMRERIGRMNLASNWRPHFLWYRRHEGVIELAGADSEAKDDLEDLRPG